MAILRRRKRGEPWDDVFWGFALSIGSKRNLCMPRVCTTIVRVGTEAGVQSDGAAARGITSVALTRVSDTSSTRT